MVQICRDEIETSQERGEVHGRPFVCQYTSRGEHVMEIWAPRNDQTSETGHCDGMITCGVCEMSGAAFDGIVLLLLNLFDQVRSTLLTDQERGIVRSTSVAQSLASDVPSTGSSLVTTPSCT